MACKNVTSPTLRFRSVPVLVLSPASAVLKDQNDVRLCERVLRRTDQVMNQWGNRNGRVGELIDLLDALQLFKQRDFILSRE